MRRAPNLIHYCFGMQSDFGGRPFGLIQYLAVLSAKVVNQPDEIWIWGAHQPSGEWWDRALMIANWRPIEEIADWGGVPRSHYAHRADIVRLLALQKFGGTYLDLDVICVRPLHHLRIDRAVLGYEDAQEDMLCNAVIIAPPEDAFVQKMLEAQNEFQPGMWEEISVQRTAQLARAFPDLIQTAPRATFHEPGWKEKDLFFSSMDPPYTPRKNALCHHLWANVNHDQLSRLTIPEIQTAETFIGRLLRPLLSQINP